MRVLAICYRRRVYLLPPFLACMVVHCFPLATLDCYGPFWLCPSPVRPPAAVSGEEGREWTQSRSRRSAGRRRRLFLLRQTRRSAALLASSLALVARRRPSWRGAVGHPALRYFGRCAAPMGTRLTSSWRPCISGPGRLPALTGVCRPLATNHWTSVNRHRPLTV